MRAYDRLWIMAMFFAIWELVRYGQTGSDIILILAYVFLAVAAFFFLYCVHLNNTEMK